MCVTIRCDSFCVPEEPPCVCVTVWCSLLCVPVEPPCLCWLLVEAYQWRQLSAQLASPSFIEEDVIVRGLYLGVCLYKFIICIAPLLFPSAYYSATS